MWSYEMLSCYCKKAKLKNIEVALQSAILQPKKTKLYKYRKV